MIKIMLVDDHQIIRDGVKSHLEKNSTFEVIAEAASGKKALEILKKVKPDLIIMDIHMDDMDGITCTQKIVKLYPDIKILALTMHDESQYIRQMLTAGASGYLLKNCDQKELYYAIDQIINQGNYFSPKVTKTVMSKLYKEEKGAKLLLQIPLTDREKEVLHLILKEYSNKEIAEALFIGLRTVDAHKRNLLEKTNSKNIAGLVLYALNNQVFDDF